MAQQVSSNCPLDENVVKKSSKIIYNYLLRQLRDPNEAADVLQQVFLNALEHNNFEGRSSIGTWLYAIARNEVYHHRQRTQRNQLRFQDFQLDDIHSEIEDPEQVLMRSERENLARKILEAGGRKVLPLFLLSSGNSIEEIAEELNLPPGTVKSRMHYARAQLIRQYGEAYRQL